MELRPLIGWGSSTGGRSRTSKRGATRRISRFGVAAIIYVVGLFGATVGQAQEISRIDQVKAAFVLNIARFVTWPASHTGKSDRMQLCLYRKNPLQQAMETIAGEEIGGRLAEIRQIQTLTDIDPCNILLISQDQLTRFLDEVPADFMRPILTVADLTETDLPIELRRGILIALIRNGSRIAFEINLEKARQSGLRMSSELLKLANIVGGSE